jgi:hypothetical protein
VVCEALLLGYEEQKVKEDEKTELVREMMFGL